MKRLWLLVLLPSFVGAQQLVNCDPAQVTPCTTNSASNTGSGDPAWFAFGKYNANWLLISPVFSAPTGTIVGNALSPGPVQNLTTLPFTLGVPAGGTGRFSLTGPIKGNGSAPFTPASSSDIIALFTGTPTGAKCLGDSGALLTCSGGGGSSSANPTALVGPTAVNGTAPTLMTSDSAPAINLTASYTWATGTHAFNGGFGGTGVATYLASPPAIGGAAPAAAAFTTLAASSTISGAGFTTYFASPPALGGVAPNTGAFTTLSATSTVSGAGFIAYLASPPGIGGTVPGSGAFTNLSSTVPIALLIQTAATSSSFTPTVGAANQLNQANTQTAGTLTVNNPTGSPTDGQRLTLRLTCTNVQTFAWGTAYHGSTTAALPTATTGGGAHDYYLFIYDTATSQWDYMSSVTGF